MLWSIRLDQNICYTSNKKISCVDFSDIIFMVVNQMFYGIYFSKITTSPIRKSWLRYWMTIIGQTLAVTAPIVRTLNHIMLFTNF